jgi:hypothetical protein
VDVDVLAGQVVPYISAAVSAYGESVCARLDEVATGERVQIGLRLIRDLLGVAGMEPAVVAMATSHGDPDFEAALRAKIKIALRQDNELAARLAAQLPVAQPVPADRSIRIGRDNSGPVSSGDYATNFQHVSGKNVRLNVDNSVGKKRFLFIPVGFFVNVTKKVSSAASAHPVAASLIGTVIVAGGITSGVALSRSDDPILGRWQDNNGRIVEFSSGAATTGWDGQIIAQGTDNVCPLDTMHLTGSAGHYSGIAAFYSVAGGKCGAHVGDGMITIDITADGTHANVITKPPAGNSSTCNDCAPAVWTKS